jgi:hypothetical protein
MKNNRKKTPLRGLYNSPVIGDTYCAKTSKVIVTLLLVADSVLYCPLLKIPLYCIRLVFGLEADDPLKLNVRAWLTLQCIAPAITRLLSMDRLDIRYEHVYNRKVALAL